MAQKFKFSKFHLVWRKNSNFFNFFNSVKHITHLSWYTLCYLFRNCNGFSLESLENQRSTRMRVVFLSLSDNFLKSVCIRPSDWSRDRWTTNQNNCVICHTSAVSHLTADWENVTPGQFVAASAAHGWCSEVQEM